MRDFKQCCTIEKGRFNSWLNSLTDNPCGLAKSKVTILSLVVGPGVARIIWIVGKVTPLHSIRSFMTCPDGIFVPALLIGERFPIGRGLIPNGCMSLTYSRQQAIGEKSLIIGGICRFPLVLADLAVAIFKRQVLD